jgi:hypothetical protein
MSDNIYYLIAPNTPAAQSVKEWQDKAEEHRKAVKALLDPIVGDYRVVAMRGTIVGISNPRTESWRTFIERLPGWRVNKARGFDYLTPRRTGEYKQLAVAFDALPRPHSIEWLKEKLTGSDAWDAWTIGRTYHGMGLKCLPDGGAIIVVDYAITKRPTFVPAEGMQRAPAQTAAMDEWHAKDPDDKEE